MCLNTQCFNIVNLATSSIWSIFSDVVMVVRGLWQMMTFGMWWSPLLLTWGSMSQWGSNMHFHLGRGFLIGGGLIRSFLRLGFGPSGMSSWLTLLVGLLLLWLRMFQLHGTQGLSYTVALEAFDCFLRMSMVHCVERRPYPPVSVIMAFCMTGSG